MHKFLKTLILISIMLIMSACGNQTTDNAPVENLTPEYSESIESNEENEEVDAYDVLSSELDVTDFSDWQWDNNLEFTMDIQENAIGKTFILDPSYDFDIINVDDTYYLVDSRWDVLYSIELTQDQISIIRDIWRDSHFLLTYSVSDVIPLSFVAIPDWDHDGGRGDGDIPNDYIYEDSLYAYLSFETRHVKINGTCTGIYDGNELESGNSI